MSYYKCVDNYALLKTQIKELEEQLVAAREEILAKGQAVIEGRTAVVEISNRTNSSIDRDLLAELLTEKQLASVTRSRETVAITYKVKPAFARLQEAA